MNTKTLKGMGAAVSLLVGIGTASPVLATSTGPQALDFAERSIDVWTFSCPGTAAFTTVSADAQVLDIAPANVAAQMEVVLGHNGFPTDFKRDPAEGDLVPSLNAVVSDGPGLYAMAFRKNANNVDGVEGYVGRARCVDAAGNIFNPALTLRINQ